MTKKTEKQIEEKQPQKKWWWLIRLVNVLYVIILLWEGMSIIDMHKSDFRYCLKYSHAWYTHCELFDYHNMIPHIIWQEIFFFVSFSVCLDIIIWTIKYIKTWKFDLRIYNQIKKIVKNN
jgi:hypothetical protein